MSTMIQIAAQDGHRLDAYLARPTGKPRGGVVIGQEMYGLTGYLSDVCDFYAGQGYLTIAPALYDRRERGLVLAYTLEDHDRAQKIYKNWNWEHALDDLDAGNRIVSDAGKVALVGFCWGGTLAWLAACRRDYACAVAYYGSMMPDFRLESARCPVIAHIGTEDGTFTQERIDLFHQAQPEVPIYRYGGAGHGFDNPSRKNRYHDEGCRVARERTLEFLAGSIG